MAAFTYTPALDARETDPLQELFPQQQDVPLAQVLDTIDRHCGMLGAFAHWQQIHISPVVSRPALLAGIMMGLGCGIGVRKMARISARLTEHDLEHVVNWRFSLENIRTANDRVLKGHGRDGTAHPLPARGGQSSYRQRWPEIRGAR